MKRNSKWVFWGFFSLDYKAVQIYLEEMASKGWMLEKINRVFAKFKAIEPKKLKFCVDVFRKGGPLTPENTKEAKEYRALCEDAGWHFITSLDYLQYFYADANDEITPIQTDAEIERRLVTSTLLKNELMGLILFMIIAGFTTVLHFPINYKNLLNYVGVFGTYVFPVLYGVVLIPLIYNLTWFFKTRQLIRNGYPISEPSLRAARLRSIAANTPMFIILGLFIVAFSLDVLLKPQVFMSVLFAPLLGISVGLGLRHLIKKRATDKKDTVLYVTFAFLIIISVSALVSNSNVNFSEEDYNRIAVLPNEYPRIDLGQLYDDSQLVRSGFERGKSPVVPVHYTYWENRTVGEEEVNLSIRYYHAKNVDVARIIFRGVRDEIEKGIKWKGDYYLSKTMRSDELMKASWDVENFAISEEKDEIVVQKGNKVVRMSGALDFEDEKLKDLVNMNLLDSN